MTENGTHFLCSTLQHEPKLYRWFWDPVMEYFGNWYNPITQLQALGNIKEVRRGGESAAERQRIEFKTSVLLVCDLKMATFLRLCVSKVGRPTIALEMTCFWVPGRPQQFEQRTRKSLAKWTRSSGCPLRTGYNCDAASTTRLSHDFRASRKVARRSQSRLGCQPSLHRRHVASSRSTE